MPTKRSSKAKAASRRVSLSQDSTGTNSTSSILGPERVTEQAPSVATPASDASTMEEIASGVVVEESEGTDCVLIANTPLRSPLRYESRRIHPGIYPPRGPVMPVSTAAPTAYAPGPMMQTPTFQITTSQHPFMQPSWGPFFTPTNIISQPQPEPTFMAQLNNSSAFGPSAMRAPMSASNGQSYVFTGPGHPSAYTGPEQPSLATAPLPVPYTQAPAVAQCDAHRPRHQFFPVVDAQPPLDHDDIATDDAIRQANYMLKSGRFNTSIRHSVALLRELTAAVTLADFSGFGNAEMSWICTAEAAAVELNRAVWNRTSFGVAECSCADRRESEKDNHQASA